MTKHIYGASRIPGPSGLHAYGDMLPPARFYAPPKPPAFTKISRVEFFETALERMMDISKISQRGSSLCGPASLMFLLGKHRPAEYFRFVSELYEYGRSWVGNLSIEPGEDCKNYDPSGKMAGADWVALAGIRDSENDVFDYDETGDAFAGITLPHELASWLDAAGFKDIVNETNLYLTKNESDFQQAIDFFNAGYDVCLFIDADGIESGATQRGAFGQIFTSPNHWVVLTSIKEIKPESVNFTVFSWGEGARRVPQDAAPMRLEHWLQYFYGFVACRA